MRQISIRQIQRDFNKEIQNLPFVVVKRRHRADKNGTPVCVVSAYRGQEIDNHNQPPEQTDQSKTCFSRVLAGE